MKVSKFFGKKKDLDKAAIYASIVLVITLSILLYSNDDNPPYPASDFTGKAVHNVYSGFIQPEARIQINGTNITFNNDSEIKYVSFNFHDYVIYNKAYISFDGQQWREINLTPMGEVKDSWIRKTAGAVIGMNKAALRINETRNETLDNYIIIYSCAKGNGVSWDCHGGWQIIDFRAKYNVTLPPVTPPINTTPPVNITPLANAKITAIALSGSINGINCSATMIYNHTITATIRFLKNDIVANTQTVSARNNSQFSALYTPDYGTWKCNVTVNGTSNSSNSLTFTEPVIPPTNPGTVLECSSCNFIITPSQTFLTPANFPGLKPGDKICFPAGIRPQIAIQNIKGTAAQPLIFSNCGAGQAVIDGNNYSNVAFWIQNVSYFKMTGSGDPNTRFGIKVANNKNSAIVATARSTDMEYERIEIAGGLGTGFSLKSDPRCDGTHSLGNFVQYNTLVHDNYIHDNGNEGMYLGSSHFVAGVTMTCNGNSVKIYEHELRGVRIYNNILMNTGHDGIQVGSAVADTEIYNNTVINAGAAKVYGHTASLMINPGTTGRVYNNFVDGGEQGVFLQGWGDNYIYNNIITNTWGDGMMTTAYVNFVRPGYGYYIDNNIIRNASGYGIWHLTLNSTGNTFRNNIIIGAKNGAIRLNTGREQLTVSNNMNNSNINYYKFVNPAAGNYRLQSDSPLIDAGTSTADKGITSDMDGVSRPKGNAYDIGPFEYNGAATPPPTTDNDGDGYISTNDCNDNSASVWILRTGYADSDGDAYTVGSSQSICSGASLPGGYISISSGTDCNDNNANINPGRTEICGNSIDEDCSAGDLTCPVIPPAPTCNDGLQNGNETGTDCGGPQCSACQVSEPSGDGLVLSYNFDTNAAIDDSGNGRDGIVSGATWSALGNSGYFTFDGDDYITVSNSNNMDGYSAFTIEFWAYDNNTSQHEYIISKRRETSSSWAFYNHVASYWTFSVNTNSGTQWPVAQTGWNHVIGVWNGTSYRIYRDGTVRQTVTYSATMATNPSIDVIIGARNSGSFNYYFYTGKLGEIHVYDKALTSNEVSARYNETKGKYN